METQSNPLPMDTTSAPTHTTSTFSVALAALIIGGLLVTFSDPYLPASLSNTKQGYETGFAAARKVAEESKYGDFFRSKADIRYVSGAVTAIDGNRVTMRVQESNPFDGLTESEKTVIIAPTTRILKFTPKDPAVYQKELDAFNKSPESKVAGAVPPLSVSFVILDSSSIKVDTTIVAVATENIKGMDEFTANEIQVVPKITLGR